MTKDKDTAAYWKKKTFNIRVREEKIGYYSLQAKNLPEAEEKALSKLRGETEGEVCPAVEFSFFVPEPMAVVFIIEVVEDTHHFTTYHNALDSSSGVHLGRIIQSPLGREDDSWMARFTPVVAHRLIDDDTVVEGFDNLVEAKKAFLKEISRLMNVQATEKGASYDKEKNDS